MSTYINEQKRNSWNVIMILIITRIIRWWINTVWSFVKGVVSTENTASD